MRTRIRPDAIAGPFSRSLGFSLLASVLMVTPAFAQTAPAPAPANPQPPQAASTIQSSVSEVSLDLVVRDKKNRAILNLTPEDVVVTDNGAPVKISTLRLAAAVPGSPKLLTVVFDRLSTAEEKTGRAIAEKILKELPEQDFKIAVLSADGRLRLLQQYTTDRASIEQALAVATESPGTDLSNESAKAEKTLTTEATLPGNPGAAARMTYAALTASQQMVVSQKVPVPIAALTALAQAQRQIPGRKVMLYFTAGLEADSLASEMIKTAAGEANRAGVSLYAIDMSAISLNANQELMVTNQMGAQMAAVHFNPPPAATQFSPGDTTPAGIKAQATANTQNLEFSDSEYASTPIGRLAEATGGRYIPAQVNMSKPIRQLLDDMTTFYVATYASPIVDFDGSFRAIAVKPLRKDITIRTRSGYFAVPPSDTAGLRPFEMPLLSLLHVAQPPTDFSFSSRVVSLGNLPAGLTQEAVVETPISELEIRHDNSSHLYSVHANLLVQIVDSSDKVIEQFGQELRRHGALDTVETARSEMLSFHRAFVAPPGKYTLKVAAFDAIAGKAAVQQQAFDVQPANPGPALSDLVMVRRVEPPVKGRDQDAGIGDPLHSANGEIIPNIDGAVPVGAKEVSLFFIIHPGPATLGKAALEMTVSRDGHVIGHAPLTFHESSDGSPVPYFTKLGTKSMSTGEYNATVRLTQGGQSLERSVSLKIEKSAADAEAAAAKPNESATTSSPGGGAEANEDAASALPPLVVTPAGADATPPSSAEIDRILEQARKRALAYSEGLPNFMCLESTNRSVDTAGKSHWKHSDSYAELLTYRNHAETRRMMAVNGQQTDKAPDDLKGVTSHGEFGGILNAIFQPTAHATFVWKESGIVGGERVDVFGYRVAQKDSSFGLTGDNNWQINAAFQGLVSIDAATLDVRQVTIVAEDLPKDFSIHATAIRVDYNYIAINGHDYLLPVRATVSLRRHKHEAVLNEIEFHDYKRFGTRSRMVPVAQ